MFSWICPRCGNENRPSDTECPRCKELDAKAPAPPPPFDARETVDIAPPPPPLPIPVPDPLHVVLQHSQSRRQIEETPKRSGLPTWLLSIVFAFAFVGLGAAIFYGYQRYQKGGGAGFTGGETPANTPKPKGTSSLQKYIEVVGIRVTTDAKKKPEARFVVVNHSTTELEDLTANVTLWASTSRSEEDSVGTFTFKIPSILPNQAKEFSTILKTKLKIYEMPDWQNVTAEVQITSP